MKNLQVKISLILNYMVFAILLNSVGTVILQVQNNYGITESSASVLEAFKDLSIAITSFLVASFVLKIGYKKSMLISLGLVLLACLAMPALPSFWMTKVLFAVTGISFALTKVSVFATIGIVTNDEKEHVSFMNFLESFFMIGIFSGYFFFSYFVDDANPASTAWLQVYYLLAVLTAIAFVLLWLTPLDESKVLEEEPSSPAKDFTGMVKLIGKPLVLTFIISAFIYVLIEQGIMSWLPSFNSKILHLSNSLAIQMASILAISTAAGRFLGGIILKKVDWYKVLPVCLVAAGALVFTILPLAEGVGTETISSWSQAPMVAFLFPMIGLALAPIYPALNSVILSALPKRQHAPMAGLIVVFSALGGTTGSIITGYMFEHFDGKVAFSLSIIPIGLMLVILFFFRRETKKVKTA
jgi:FHS family glucose/mannose:H+ symporter-like MFS transporter